jgi:hypothetical protein
VGQLIKELGKITPLSDEIKSKKSKFGQESDSSNYLLEYVDKDAMIRVRNYLMNTTLPPDPPDKPNRFYNLIEITKFYDTEVKP